VISAFVPFTETDTFVREKLWVGTGFDTGVEVGFVTVVPVGVVLPDARVVAKTGLVCTEVLPELVNPARVYEYVVFAERLVSVKEIWGVVTI
jgi:hypothetical protein